MTAVALVGALRFAWHDLRRLDGLSRWQQLVLLVLKSVAVLGYHLGKCVSRIRQRTRAGPSQGPPSAAAGSPLPSVERAGAQLLAVVIPVYANTTQAVRLLKRAVEGLSKQRRPVDVIIVVDDAGSQTLPDFEVAQVILLRLSHNSGPAAARNAGISRAKECGAAIICFLDADCIPNEDWIEVMEAAQQARPGIIAGRTLADRPNTSVGLYHDVCGTLNGRRMPDGSLLYGCTCNLSVALAAVDPAFNTSFRRAAFEDVELCVRARKAGVPLAYVPAALVRHAYAYSLAGLFRQLLRYGLYEGQMFACHADYPQMLWASKAIPSLPVLEAAP